MKVLQGELVETQYYWPQDQTLSQSPTESSVLNDDSHQVPGAETKAMKVKLENVLTTNQVTYMHGMGFLLIVVTRNR